jgi:hypothetical protein
VPLVSKKKADIKFNLALLHKGNPPLVRFPSAELGLGIHPSVALWKDKGISPSAEGDRRSRRLRRAFEKARAKLSNGFALNSPINCNLYYFSPTT